MSAGLGVLRVGTDEPRAGIEYSQVVDRGEAAVPVRLLVAIVESFSGGVGLRVSLEGSADGEAFTTLAEGPLVLEEHLTRGTRMLEAIVPSGPRYLRLRYDSGIGAGHRTGQLFGGLVETREAA